MRSGFPQLPRFSWRVPEEAANRRDSPPPPRRGRIFRRFRGPRARKFHSAKASARSAMSRRGPATTSRPATARCGRAASRRPRRRRSRRAARRRARPPARARPPGRRRRRRPQLGHVARAGGDEGAPAGRHAQLVSPVRQKRRATRHVPGQRSAADEHRRRPEQTSPSIGACQVHAEERQVRVGHRVDQPADERARVRAQAQVPPAERHDARVLRRAAATARRPACPPAQTTARRAAASARSRRDRAVLALEAGHRAPEDHLAAGAAQSSASARATAAKSTMPVWGECSAGDAGAVGLELAHLVGAQRRSPGTPFARPRRSSSSRRAELALVQRDDQLAAALVGDAALLAERVQARGPSTQSRAFSEPGV